MDNNSSHLHVSNSETEQQEAATWYRCDLAIAKSSNRQEDSYDCYGLFMEMIPQILLVMMAYISAYNHNLKRERSLVQERHRTESKEHFYTQTSMNDANNDNGNGKMDHNLFSNFNLQNNGMKTMQSGPNFVCA